MKHFGINSARRVSGRSLPARARLFSFCLFFFLFIFLPVPLPLPFPFFPLFPADTCRRAHTSREPTSEKCNLSISAPQRKDKQCWKNEGDKHAAELMLDKHVAFPPIHKWPCHVRRSQVWKFKDKLDCARGRCCCFWACLLVVLVSLLFDRFAPWGMRSFKMTAEGWVLLKDENEGISLHQTLSSEGEKKNKKRQSRGVRSAGLEKTLGGIRESYENWKQLICHFYCKFVQLTPLGRVQALICDIKSSAAQHRGK